MPSGEPASQAHLDLANQAYENGSFDAALREYRAAYDLCGSAMVLFGAAHSESALGRKSEAARDFERFLREASDADEGLRQQAAASLRALSAQLTLVQLAGAVDRAMVVVDGQAMNGWTRGMPIYLSPGSHTVRIDGPASGTIERVVSGTMGGRLRMDIPDSAGLLIFPQPPTQQPPRRHWWLWGGIAAVLIAGAITGYAVSRSDRPPCPSVCP